MMMIITIIIIFYRLALGRIFLKN